MHGHHHPIVLLAKLGGKWLLAGAVLFLLFNPVTIGALLAIFDRSTGSDTGAWLVNGPQPVKSNGTCDLRVNGHVFTIQMDCNRVQFPGPKRGA